MAWLLCEIESLDTIKSTGSVGVGVTNPPVGAVVCHVRDLIHHITHLNLKEQVIFSANCTHVYIQYICIFIYVCVCGYIYEYMFYIFDKLDYI